MFQYNIPFCAIAKMTGGLVSIDMIQGNLLVVNGHFIKGMGKVITRFFSTGEIRNNMRQSAFDEKFRY